MKLSIITINFNNLAGLQRTYESVVCQTFTDYEWIVIDGGSNDGSREFIEQHQDKFAYWCSEPDKGIYNAMNKGISRTKGEYLNFMNSGDMFLDKDVIKKVFQQNAFSDIISCRAIRQDNGKRVRSYDDNVFFQIMNDTLDHQGAFIKKSLFDRIKYDERLRIVSDWKFWIESIVLGRASVEYSDMVVAIQDTTGISSINTYLMNDERKRVFNELFPPMIQKVLNDYKRLKDSEYVVRSEYLLTHSPTFYVIGRRFLAFLIKLSKMMGK